MDEIRALAQRVVKELINRRISIAAAESMTGGYFAKVFTDVPGASYVLDRSIVTYSNKSKNEELNVPFGIIEKYSAVSSEVAEMMASGLYAKTYADICISITGVAGPGPDDRGIPAGTFYIGFRTKDLGRVYKFSVGELGRAGVREVGVLEMFKTIADFLGILDTTTIKW